MVALVGGAKGRVVDGVLEVAGGRLAGCGGVNGLGNGRGFVAITFGHVVVGTGHDVLAELRAHEHEHVRQYEQWGALFFVAYLGSGALEWLRGRHPYWHNPFERRARAAQRAADERRNALAVRPGGRCQASKRRPAVTLADASPVSGSGSRPAR